MGYDQNAFSEDTIILYTKDSMTYDNKLDPTSLEAKIANKKTISARWIHKKEDGKFELITQD
jgi:hypothetical protein